ncbi:MAG TPA: carbamoyltransferase C-terminal domain-containing protein [Burkholderiaceae bacterium]|nr:carbamoyltransferase C-terminal domain-containing protein [Burkholderiaceae bacterium]
MITLGINAAFHDSSAALVIDGRLVAAAEDERFTRIKHGKRPVPFTAWELPFHAIDYCLAQAGVRLADVDHVAYSYDPRRFIRDRLASGRIELPVTPSAHDAGVWENVWDPLFASYVLNAPRQLASAAPHHLKARFADVRHDGPFRWHYVDHHQCHQASAFLAAPFERCAVMTLDGRGEEATTTYGVWTGERYEPLGEVAMPHSLGLLYERITSHLGFLHSSDEYKVMALAALGRPVWLDTLRELVRVRDGGCYEILPFDPAALFGPARRRGEPLEQRHFDLTASLQAVLEETVLELAGWLRRESGERRLAMAGGVALNCVMNAKVRDARLFDEVWVQPAAGDAGTALGAALWVDWRERSERAGRPVPREWVMEHAYWGPAYGDEEIEQLLRWAKLRYRRLDDVPGETARLLAADHIVGWFQGRMEFGPRALGARSILASPLDAGMQARLNELKDREDFRPVAPVVPQDDLASWFTPADANRGQAPFMLFVYDVLPGQADRIPAVCHADRTARVQTVRRDTNPRYHDTLRAFGALTGVPVLVNTSFNVRGEPIVCTPRDAVNAFFSTPLDALVIGSFLVEKSA